MKEKIQELDINRAALFAFAGITLIVATAICCKTSIKNAETSAEVTKAIVEALNNTH